MVIGHARIRTPQLTPRMTVIAGPYWYDQTYVHVHVAIPSAHLSLPSLALAPPSPLHPFSLPVVPLHQRLCYQVSVLAERQRTSTRYPRALVLHVSCAEQTWGAAGVGKSHRRDPKGQSVGEDRGDHVGTKSQKTNGCGDDITFSNVGRQEKKLIHDMFAYASLQLTGAMTCEPRRDCLVVWGSSVSLRPRSSKRWRASAIFWKPDGELWSMRI